MKHVVDTHAYLWFLTGDARLSSTARAVFADPDGEFILPATALAEACWIVEHGRTSIPSVPALLAALDADPRFVVVPLDRTIIEKSTTLLAIGEMHDREIVAVALDLAGRGEDTVVITRDLNITASGLVHVLW
jgi:PIN domain nuclease of toxin-antitoxin system